MPKEEIARKVVKAAGFGGFSLDVLRADKDLATRVLNAEKPCETLFTIFCTPGIVQQLIRKGGPYTTGEHIEVPSERRYSEALQNFLKYPDIE